MPIEDSKEDKHNYNILIWKIFDERVSKNPSGWTLLLGAGNAAPEDKKLFSTLDPNHDITLTNECTWVNPVPTEKQVLSLCLDFNNLLDLTILTKHLRMLKFPVKQIVVDRGVAVHFQWSLLHLQLIYHMLPIGGKFFINQDEERKFTFTHEDIKEMERKEHKDLIIQPVLIKIPVLAKEGTISQYKTYLQKQVAFKPNSYSNISINILDKSLPFVPWTHKDQLEHNIKLIQAAGFRIVRVIDKNDLIQYPIRKGTFPFIYAVK